jgi:hypothetical protein
MGLCGEFANALRALTIANWCDDQDVPIGREFEFSIGVDVECLEQRPVDDQCKAVPRSR